jgi:hypothetical protein
MATNTNTETAEWVAAGLKLLRRYKGGQVLNLSALQQKLIKSGLAVPPTPQRWGTLVARAQRDGILEATGNTTRVNGRSVREYQLIG